MSQKASKADAEPNSSDFGLATEDPSVDPAQEARDVQDIAKQPAQDIGGTITPSNEHGPGSSTLGGNPQTGEGISDPSVGPFDNFDKDGNTKVPSETAPATTGEVSGSSAESNMYPMPSRDNEMKEAEQLAQEENE
ncbi:hypothetical protein MYAM1_000218 [Malassezia yamatoensis]|uniref:Uncharacterized protein n=1 Tax=Malassezia yamatoensis TaxID=253288 RepID=A0AAJ5YNE6_9BASI|nr:hypothetical protein MYAM1_000218 [Malassezia yamatoensis]